MQGEALREALRVGSTPPRSQGVGLTGHEVAACRQEPLGVAQGLAGIPVQGLGQRL